MFDSTVYDVEPRRKFGASQAAHFVLTGIILLCSGTLLLRSTNCPEYDTWNEFLFFGSLIWMVYLLLTFVIQFTNKVTRIFLNYLDWLFLLFHIGMGIWAWFFLKVEPVNSTCASRWPLWVMIYRALAIVGLFCVTAMLLMRCMRKFNTGLKTNDEVILSNIEGEYDQLDQSAL